MDDILIQRVRKLTHLEVIGSLEKEKTLKQYIPNFQKEELEDITNYWVDACLNIEKKSLRRMEIIINAQSNKGK